MSCTRFGASANRQLLTIAGLLTAMMLAPLAKPAAADPPTSPAADAPKVLWHKVPYESEDADAALADGIRAYNAGNYDLAIAAFSKALEFRPRFADATFDRGIAFLALKDFDRAVAEFNTVIEAKPKLFDAYLELGQTYLAKGDLAKARFNADAALKLKPSSKDAAQLVADIGAASAPRK